LELCRGSKRRLKTGRYFQQDRRFFSRIAAAAVKSSKMRIDT